MRRFAASSVRLPFGRLRHRAHAEVSVARSHYHQRYLHQTF
ncbi:MULTISPECIES: hypothetical protein [unclassified Coleofasciculus]|nr:MULTISPECIES: hypothetical protein [unclassified Coleofasciculus]